MKTTRPNMLWMRGWMALLASTWLFALPALAAQNALNTVSVAEGQNDSQVIKIVLKDAMEGDPVSFSTSNPHRLVLDFANTANNTGRAQETVNAGVIKNYHVVQSGERTRIVFNLNAPASHELRKERNVVLAVLRGSDKSASATATVAPTRFAETGKQREHGIRDVEFRRGKNGEGRIAVTLSDPGVGIDIQQKGTAIQVDFLNTSLPTPLQRRLDVTDFATPTQMVETFEEGKNTRMLVTPRGRWDYSAYQTGGQFIIEVRSLDDPQLSKIDRPLYTGQKLTLNFQEVDVRQVLHVIAEEMNSNIIASDTVTGKTTLRLKDVPIDQALDIILLTKGLGKERSGNVIWVAPSEEIASRKKTSLQDQSSIEDIEKLYVQVYQLNYMRADEAYRIVRGGKRTLGLSASAEMATCSPSATGIKGESAASDSSGEPTGDGSFQDRNAPLPKADVNINVNYGRMLSRRGGASYDLQTNSLVITDVRSSHEKVAYMLENLDKPARQVMIEARIVVADDNFNRDLGVKLGFQTTGRLDGTSIGISSTRSDSISIAGANSNKLAGNTTYPGNINLPVAGIAGAPSLGISILNAAANTMLSLELLALEADKRGKVVSNPRVVTTNLRPAVILQGSQIPYLSASNAGTETQFKDAVLCLLVAPQILNNDAIILNVEVTQDVPDRTVSPPAINVKRVKTQVRVNNGETAILGGIFEQTLSVGTDKVPFLGDIPVLGNLFKSTSKKDEKTEMLIFLTPRIIDDRLGGIR